VRAVLDTNILIDLLSGVEKGRAEIDRYTRRTISIVTWMEVMVGARDAGEEDALRAFLLRFDVAPLTTEIASEAVSLRREHGLGLPDAIIWATARVSECLLVTRNTSDFPADDPGVRFPYQV
jgi:predicted nucleic acid-binding protein